MKANEASELLSAGLNGCDPKQCASLASDLGEWPLLIKFVNRYLFDRVEAGQPVADALRFVSSKLKRQGLTAFDAEDADQRNAAVSKTVGVSLDLLDPNKQVPRLFELSIFPEDEDIPLDVVASLWQQTGGIDDIDSEELCERYFKLSLILELDLGRRTLRLHDALRSYYHSQLSNCHTTHDHLLQRWTDPYNLPNAYAWKWYGYHLANSSQSQALIKLLSDFKWLNAKLNATDVNSLLAEFKHVPNKADSLRLIESAILLSAHVSARDKTQLASQILGRLPPNTNTDADAVRAEIMNYTHTAWLEPVRATLQSAGGPLIRTLEHSNSVFTVALSADDRHIVSGSSDGTIKVWDLASGDCLRTLEAGYGGVCTMALSGDDRFIVCNSWTMPLKSWILHPAIACALWRVIPSL